MTKLTLTYGIGIFVAIAYACMAANAAPPYTVKSHQVRQDDDYVYYSDTRSDGREITRKVRKPKPRKYPQSVTLIATNDLPVQMQYVYEELYADGHVKTNYQYRTKTAREQSKIKLPPMPEITTRPPRNKADALRLAKQRQQPAPRKPDQPLTHATMARPDRVVKSEVVNGRIKHTLSSGKVQFAPLRKTVTARVKSAPVKKKETR